MITLAQAIATNPSNRAGSPTLVNQKINWKDCYDKRIKYLKVPDCWTELNSEWCKYKFALERQCWWRTWKIIEYEWQYYIWWLNLIPFRLYRWKLNVLECIKFLCKHLNDGCFTLSNYRRKIYPLFK